MPNITPVGFGTHFQCFWKPFLCKRLPAIFAFLLSFTFAKHTEVILLHFYLNKIDGSSEQEYCNCRPFVVARKVFVLSLHRVLQKRHILRSHLVRLHTWKAV